MEPREDEAPIKFSFPKPFESYAGEFPRVHGECLVHKSGTTCGFLVFIMDATLGEDELDNNVRNNAEMLAGGRFPSSTFLIRSMAPSVAQLDKPIDLVIDGALQLKGVTVPIKAPARWTPIHRDLVRFKGGFVIESLRERFTISGPGVEGDPAGDRVEVTFDVNLSRVAGPGGAKPGDRT